MVELKDIVEQARDELATANDAVALDEVRVRYMGKQGLLTQQRKGLGKLPAKDTDLNRAAKTRTCRL